MSDQNSLKDGTIDEFAQFTAAERSRSERPSLRVMFAWGFIAGLTTAFWVALSIWLFAF